MTMLDHAYGCGDPGIRCAACVEETPPPPPSPARESWHEHARRELDTVRRLRWIHVSTLVVLETAGVFQELGAISTAIGSRISRYADRRLRQHYQGKAPKAEA